MSSNQPVADTHLRHATCAVSNVCGSSCAMFKRTLPFEDQASVQSAVETLDKIRTDLLSRMFGKNPK